jgi:hypothetical protein
MAAPVRAVIVDVHPFSRLAVLCAEDGCSLLLTRHAAGFEEVDLCKGAWLTCSVATQDRHVLAVRPCDEPPQGFPGPHRQFTTSMQHRVDAALLLHPVLHSVPPPSEIPVIWLSTWQIFELPSGARHAWGRNNASGEGRVSSLLSHFRPKSASLRSASGRRYKLVGPPGRDTDGEYLWQLWLSVRRLKQADVTSVTDEVWAAIRASASTEKRKR